MRYAKNRLTAELEGPVYFINNRGISDQSDSLTFYLVFVQEWEASRALLQNDGVFLRNEVISTLDGAPLSSSDVLGAPHHQNDVQRKIKT